MSKEENRKRMPLCTEFIDAMRQEFPDLQVTYAKENGVELGQKPEPGCRDFVVLPSETHTIALGGVKTEKSRGRRG